LFAAAITLALAVGAGIVLAQVLMAPPAAEQRELAVYFTITGAATLVLAWVIARATERSRGLSLRAKAFLSAITGTAVALFNVLVIAQLMFISTGHDLRLLLAVIAFSGVVTVGFSLWVASTASRRITATARTIRHLASGDYAQRVRVAGSDEVARLAADVNALAERLEGVERERHALDRERKDLTTAVSHDLRTPLASMHAMLEAIDDGVVSEPHEIDRYHQTLRREVGRMSQMVDDLLELARIDAGALPLELRPIALQDVAAEVVDAMEAQAVKTRITLALAVIGDPPLLHVDGSRVERAVFNLVRNSLEHTPAGGRVDVEVQARDGFVELSVRDTGEGVSSEDLQRIWQRFYRVDKSRTSGTNADGIGLGLAIVRGIVEAHGGSVDASTRTTGGSQFTILLPRTPYGATVALRQVAG
jgi:signal transduction histidine kinase